jgi:thiamine biosynthesis protein ThiS
MSLSIRINGAQRELPDGATVAELVRVLALRPEQVAVERNGVLVRRAQHEATLLADADVIEVVTLVGGG